MSQAVDLKRRAGTPFDQIVDGGRTPSATGGGGTSSKTFTELLKGGGVRAPRCRCGATATVSLQVTARPLGTGNRAKAIATTTVKLCEPCAVHIYEGAR
jgi:hypothetical protein